MSVPGKPQPHQLHEFSEPPFGFPTPASASQPPTTHSLTAAYTNTPHTTQINFNSHDGRPSYHGQSGGYGTTHASALPQVTAYHPQHGQAGNRMLVYVSSIYDLTNPAPANASLIFGSRRCAAAMHKLEDAGPGLFSYAVSTEIPRYGSTGYSSAQVPVVMILQSLEGVFICKVEVGTFTFRELDLPSAASQLDAARERRVSEGSIEDHPGFYSHQNHAYANATQYGRSNAAFPALNAQRHIYQYSGSNSTSPPIQRVASPSLWGYSANSQRASPSNIGNGPTQRPTALSTVPSPLSASSTFIRTSTLQTPLPGEIHASHSTGYAGTYNMFSHNKASLVIQGDLDSMTENWNREEWDAQRRIVMFRRSQSGSKITATFKPVSVNARPQNAICISCIYWKEKEECYVTSVDTIYLLEQLVNLKFTVEEKNRIRRNLEGFRPATVSKGKSDSENFFKIIMGFPNPKPRNIEKDVKVFPWKVLNSSLKKIIGKYSASPSSTIPPTPALLTPSSSTGYIEVVPQHQNSTSADMHVLMSPRSATHSLPQSYSQTMTSRDITPPSLKRTISMSNYAQHPETSNAAGHPNLYYTDAGQAQHAGYTSQAHTPTYIGTSHSARPSWDLGSMGVMPSNLVPPPNILDTNGANGYLEISSGNANSGVRAAAATDYVLGSGGNEEVPIGVSVPKLLAMDHHLVVQGQNVPVAHHLS